jgi:amino acid permease
VGFSYPVYYVGVLWLTGAELPYKTPFQPYTAWITGFMVVMIVLTSGKQRLKSDQKSHRYEQQLTTCYYRI